MTEIRFCCFQHKLTENESLDYYAKEGLLYTFDGTIGAEKLIQEINALLEGK